MPAIDISRATDQELTDAMRDPAFISEKPKVLAEIERRVTERQKTAANSLPFNPRVDVSADAKYLWKRVFIWFWIVPSAAFLIWFAVTQFAVTQGMPPK